MVRTAITAALWGVDEAISRGVPLRLVSVIKLTHPSPDDYARDLEHVETSLRQAQSAVEASGKACTTSLPGIVVRREP